MASIKIPDRAREGLKTLATLTDDQFQELHSSLELIPRRIKRHSIFDDQEIRPKSISTADFTAIKTAVFPMLLGSANIPVSLSEYVHDIVEGVTDDDESLSKDLQSQLEVRLNEILTVSPAQVVAKSYDVLTEHGCIYTSARVLTDIRPVFGQNPDVAPTAGLTVHMLNIEHLKGSDAETFVVALDAKDIQDLIDVLERAKKKNDTLRSVITSMGMEYIDVV